MAILAFLTKIFLRILGFLMSFVLVWTVPPQFATTIETLEDDVLLQFTAFSDTHVQSYDYAHFKALAQATRDAAAAKTKQDALVFLGDNTESGKPTEYLMFYSILSHYSRAKNTLVAMGNHDLNRDVYDTQEAIDRHNFFYQAFTGKAYEKPYYVQQINGYSFIVLGDEDPQKNTTATISAEQLAFLAEELGKVPADKPVFVFLHQPLNHYIEAFDSRTNYKVGAQSNDLRDLFEARDNVFVFSGHYHAPLPSLSYDRIGEVNYINVPKLLSGTRTGDGWQVEVYEDEVVLRARNFAQGEWLTDYEINVALTKEA